MHGYRNTKMYAVLFLSMLCGFVEGHAFLEDPPSRAYFAKYSTPQGMNCGGISAQWDKYGGKCGVCGDDYGGVQHNMAGGKWALGKITKTYTQGQTIDVTIRITANHLGNFHFNLCVNNDFSKKITEACLAKHPLTIIDPDTGVEGLKWKLPGGVTRKVLRLKLPKDVHCEQCVLRWYWKGGNNWGTDPVTGQSGTGFAEKQECFVNCADIEILSNGQPQPVTLTPTTPNMSTTTAAKTVGCNDNMVLIPDNGLRCTARDTSQLDVVEFCSNICSRSTFCPGSHCVCD